MLQIFLLTLILPKVIVCIEGIREPRHFNPHYNRIISNPKRYGPAVFPKAPRDIPSNRNGRDSGIISLRNDYPGNNHPYQKVSERYKQERAGRFGSPLQDNQRTRDFEAIAKLGAKVLRVPPEKLGEDHVPISRLPKKQHAFSYKVVDNLTGDDFSHSQITNSKSTNGEYQVKLPDGRRQIVSYTADKDGYKADVKYTKNEEGKEERVEERPGNLNGGPHVRRKFHPLKTERTNYLDGIRHHSAIMKLKAVAPAAQLQRYDNYDSFAVVPSAGYHPDEFGAGAGNLQIPIPLKVQIYTTNARDHIIGSYFPVETSSAGPFYYGEDHQHQQVISPQIINNGGNGIVVPGSTPSSFVLTDQHGQVIDNIRLVTSTAVPVLLSSTTATPYEDRFALQSTTAVPPLEYE